MSSKQDDAATRVQEEQERLSAQLHQDQSGASSPSGLLPMMLYNNPLNGDKMTGTDGTSLNLLNGLPSSSAKTASSRIQLAQMMRGEQTGVHSESNSNPSAGKNPPPPMTDAVENETVNAPPQPADGTEGEPEVKTVAEPAPKRKHQAPSDNSSSSKPKGKKDTKWLATLEELKQYKEANGTCIVPRGYTENPRLASWVRIISSAKTVAIFTSLHVVFQICTDPLFVFRLPNNASSTNYCRTASAVPSPKSVSISSMSSILPGTLRVPLGRGTWPIFEASKPNTVTVTCRSIMPSTRN